MSNPTQYLPALDHLTHERRWCLWRKEHVNGRQTKVPYQPSGAKARSDNPDTWVTLPEAKASAARYDGVGLMLGQGVGGIDLDMCIADEGALEPWAQTIVDRLNTYAEVSPSGRGIKLFFLYGDDQAKGASVRWGESVDLPSGDNKRREIALYLAGRYFTCTGRVWSESPMREVPASDLKWVRDQIETQRMPSKPSVPKVSTPSAATQHDDDGGLPFDLMKLIREGVVDGERSEAFFGVMGRLKRVGLSQDQALALLDRHPNGIASKYRDRLAAEVARAWAKLTAPTWPDPGPLPNALPAVAPFDMDLLPEALRGWVADIAHRMQCPPDFTAVGAVVALSSVIGARAVVKPKARDDWAVVPNLWGLIVGRPGVMKSPALAQAMAPLNRLEATERELWQPAHEAWELDCKVAELAAKQNEKQAVAQVVKDPAKARALLQPLEMPDEPKARRYVVNDATVEKLADLLAVNQWGLMVYRDELHGLLCSLDRPGQEHARSFYLTGYDGNQGHATDRITRDGSYVPRVCLAMLGGMQPGKLQSYVRDAVSGGAGDDGLLQRFGLAVWPDVSRAWEWIDQLPDTLAKQAGWSVFERLAALQPATDTEPQEWRFTTDALAIYREWAEGFEPEVRGDELHPALISHLSKYRKLIPALALIFALVDTPDSGNLIHRRELLRALAWADYLRSHAERMYAAATIPETAGAQTLLTKLKAGKVCGSDGLLMESFAPWQLAQKGWTGLCKPEDVRKAAEVLTDYGWLQREVATVGAKGGRPSERYVIHPMLLKGGA